MYLEIDGREVGVQFIGKFNVSNLLAVYGAAVMLGKKPEDVLVVMSTLHSVNGRLSLSSHQKAILPSLTMLTHQMLWRTC